MRNDQQLKKNTRKRKMRGIAMLERRLIQAAEGYLFM
jgi:hypothetical protein